MDATKAVSDNSSDAHSFFLEFSDRINHRH